MSNKIMKIIVSIVYILIVALFISLLRYTHNIGLRYVFCVSLVYNIVLLFCIDRSKKSYLIKTFAMNVVFGLAIFIVSNFRSIHSGNFLHNFKSIVFDFFQYLLTANWLIPFIFYDRKIEDDIKKYKNIKRV